MTPVPRRLAVLFLLALLGVLVGAGTLARALGGPVALAGYVVVVLLLLGLFVHRARALVRERDARNRAAAASGRTCTCCTGSQHDPVKVV